MKQRTTSRRARLIASVGLLIALLTVCPSGAQDSGVTPTNTWMDLYSSQCSFAGVPIPAGSCVAVFDAQGTQCGERMVTTSGNIAPIMPCYGDNLDTLADEGAAEGDVLSFTVNGTAATAQARARNFAPVSPDSLVQWHALDVWEVDVVVPPQPLVSIADEPALTRLTWQPAQAAVEAYEVWSSLAPYFVPGDGASVRLGTVPAGSVPLEWTHSAGAGNPALNYTYRVVSLNAAGQMVGASQAVGEFDFTLYR